MVEVNGPHHKQGGKINRREIQDIHVQKLPQRRRLENYKRQLIQDWCPVDDVKEIIGKGSWTPMEAFEITSREP